MWDKAHGLKNARMSSANDARRGERAARGSGAAAAAATERAAATDADNDDEAVLFDDDQTIEDAAELPDGGFAAVGTLAHAVGEAAKDVIARASEHKLLHPRTMDPAHDPQHVPTAAALFSHASADEMRRLGHERAADWVACLASDYLATDKRGRILRGSQGDIVTGL
jgi:hypothetical protein